MLLPLFILLVVILVYHKLSNILPAQNQQYEMKRCTYKTFYFETSDGIRIACDLYLPELDVSSTISSSDTVPKDDLNQFFASERKYPVMVAPSRYTRSLRIHWIFRYIEFFGGKPFSLVDNQFIKAFLDEGLAVFVYDIRGCGCSEGFSSFLFNDREIQDGDEIIDFIKKAPFCNGKIGLWGISYGGISAINLSIREAALISKTKGNDKERNIVASANLFHFWNIYTDLAYHGGMRFHFFINTWWRLLYCLDRQAFWRFGPGALLLIEGISPVPYETTVRCLQAQEESIVTSSESDHTKLESVTISFKEKLYVLVSTKGKGRVGVNSGRAARRAVVASHRNNFNPTSVDYTYSDDTEIITKRLVCHESNDYKLEELRNSIHGGDSVYNDSLPDQLHIGGWFDSSCKSCINAYYQIMGETGPNVKRIQSSLNQYLLLGPWTHGGLQHAFTHTHQSKYKSPFGTVTILPFSFPELLKQYMIRALALDKARTNKASKNEDTTTTTTKDDLVMHRDEKGVCLSGISSAKEVARMLTPETPVGYYVMQADYWRFCKEFPLKSKRISFSLSAKQDGASAATNLPGSYFSDSMRRSSFRQRSQVQQRHLSLIQCKYDEGPRFLATDEVPVPEMETIDSIETKVVTCDVNPKYDVGYVGSSRWTTTTDLLNPINCDMDSPLLAAQLRFTSAPLDTDLEVTGIPTIEFWVSSTNPQADLFVSLQCVQENGVSCYVTEGCLRLMHRYYHNGQKDSKCPIYQPPLDYLPMRTFTQSDSCKDLSKFQLAFVDLLPVSYGYKKGQRIRIAIYGADNVHFTPVAKEPYSLNIRAINSDPLTEGGGVTVIKPGDDDDNSSADSMLISIPRHVYCSKLYLPVM